MKQFDNVYVKRIGYFKLYVIKGNDGDILIDTGFILMKNKIKRWLDKFNIKLIILTHAHVDHIWNVAYIKKLYDCEVMISKIDVCNIDNSKICAKPSNEKHLVWTKLMNWGMNKFVPKSFLIDYELNDGDIIEKFGLKLKIVSLSGHTDGSIGIVYGKYLFCGDALVNRKKKKVEVAYQNQNNEKAKESVLKIFDIKPDVIFIGHDKEIMFDKFERSFPEICN